MQHPLAVRRCAEFEMAYREGSSDELVLEHSFDKDVFFAGVPEYRPEPDHVILDVGAHIGTFAVLAASRVPRGLVHAVEACRETFNYLRVNARLNGMANLRTYHVALSDRAGVARLHYEGGNWGYSIVKRSSRRGEDVPAETLENFMNANSIGECHFAKFNCEGAEFPILLAAPASTLQRIETMLVLYHGDLLPERSPADLERRLGDCGFETVRRNETGDRGWLIATRRHDP